MKIIEKTLKSYPTFVEIMNSAGYSTKDVAENLCNISNNYIMFSDHDGVIGHTNSVKDMCLDAFCQTLWGEAITNAKLPTTLHREMHGRPMNEIFVAIAKDCYNKTISLYDGEKITERLNEYIRPEYVRRHMYDGARDFFLILRDIGTPMYILTGMEPDMIADRFRYHKFDNIFKDILGAPKTKEQNIAEILKSYPNRRIIATGDAMSEYKATIAYPGTIFLAFDMENREKRVFPPEVNILTSWGEIVWNELFQKL